MTTPNERRVLGRVWTPWKRGLVTRVEERFSVSVREPSNAATVAVDYQHAREGVVAIMLPPRPTQLAAMTIGLDWVDQYLTNGPADPETLFAESYREWKTLYRTRLDVLSSLFFMPGSGFEWLDGALINTCVEDPGESDRILERQKQLAMRAMVDVVPESLRAGLAERLAAVSTEEDTLPVGPIDDDGAPRIFSDITEDSNLSSVPPDVRPSWMDAAIEAARLYIGRNVEPAKDDRRSKTFSLNRKIATRILADLEARRNDLVASYRLEDPK